MAGVSREKTQPASQPRTREENWSFSGHWGELKQSSFSHIQTVSVQLHVHKQATWFSLPPAVCQGVGRPGVSVSTSLYTITTTNLADRSFSSSPKPMFFTKLVCRGQSHKRDINLKVGKSGSTHARTRTHTHARAHTHTPITHTHLLYHRGFNGEQKQYDSKQL